MFKYFCFYLNNIIKNISPYYHTKFEKLYERYAPKMLGFIRKYTETNEQADDYLAAIFYKVWADIQDFDIQPEKKILNLVLRTCRPILKNNSRMSII